MEENSKILRLRVLLCFLKSNAEDCTVTGISRTLGEEKYSVSRAVSSLEKDGYINRDDVRNPIITEKGYIAAQKYSERLEITLNHLLYEGVDIESAKRDAFYWALYCSDSTMEAVRATEERYRRCLLRQHQHEERQQSAAVFHGQHLSARQRQPRPSI